MHRRGFCAVPRRCKRIGGRIQALGCALKGRRNAALIKRCPLQRLFHGLGAHRRNR